MDIKDIKFEDLDGYTFTYEDDTIKFLFEKDEETWKLVSESEAAQFILFGLRPRLGEDFIRTLFELFKQGEVDIITMETVKYIMATM